MLGSGVPSAIVLERIRKPLAENVRAYRAIDWRLMSPEGQKLEARSCGFSPQQLLNRPRPVDWSVFAAHDFITRLGPRDAIGKCAPSFAP